MRKVFHKDFNRTDYASNGESAPGRMEAVMTALVKEGRYATLSPEPAGPSRRQKSLSIFNPMAENNNDYVKAIEHLLPRIWGVEERT